MPNIQEAADQLNAALDRITQVGGDPQQIQQAVHNAKQLVQTLVQQAQRGQTQEQNKPQQQSTQG